MPGFACSLRKACYCFLMAFWGIGLNGQSCLMLSRPEITPDGTTFMRLSFYPSSGAASAALRWTLEYQTSSITSLTVDDGSALSAAGKTSICTSAPAAYRCLAVGANTNTIASGVVARVAMVLAPGAPRPEIHIRNPLGASPEGYFIPMRVSSDCILRLSQSGASGEQAKK